MANEKTIKQLADEIGVSKQAIQKRINNLPDNQQPTLVGGKYIISEELAYKIRDFYLNSKKDNQPDTRNDNIGDNYKINLDSIIKDLKKDKKNLSVELFEKNKQIEKLKKLLDQQQVLTLQANKKIEALELKVEASDDQEPPLKESIQDEKKSFWARWFR